jgi:hypothetical protein
MHTVVKHLTEFFAKKEPACSCVEKLKKIGVCRNFSRDFD